MLFWWLQSISLFFWLGLDAPIEPRFLLISAGALITFSIGYLLPPPRVRGLSSSSSLMDRCEILSFWATLLLAVPAFVIALRFMAYRLTVSSYLEGSGISLTQQAVLYTHLFFGLLYIGAVDDQNSQKRRLALVIFLIVAPRLIVSLQWRRFFVAQAIVPIVCIAIARGWIRITVWNIVHILMIALFVLFVPAITRGDHILGRDSDGKPQIINYFGYMNSLGYFQDNTDLSPPCPPLLVSLTAKVIPYATLGVCTVDIGNDKGLTATIDRLLTKKYTNDMMKGTGGNYLLELYLTGGVGGVMIGSSLFGFSCRWFVELISHRSLYAAIWAECLSRALFAPRGTLGYVYERIPGLVVATVIVAALSRMLMKSPRNGINDNIATASGRGES